MDSEGIDSRLVQMILREEGLRGPLRDTGKDYGGLISRILGEQPTDGGSSRTMSGGGQLHRALFGRARLKLDTVMQCPHCQCESSEVIRVNSLKPGRTTRRRRCKDCRALFQTLEIIVDRCDVGERVSVEERLITPLVEQLRAALRKGDSNQGPVAAGSGQNLRPGSGDVRLCRRTTGSWASASVAFNFVAGSSPMARIREAIDPVSVIFSGQGRSEKP